MRAFEAGDGDFEQNKIPHGEAFPTAIIDTYRIIAVRNAEIVVSKH